MKLTGIEAIEYAEVNGLTLNKYTDPTEDAREGVTPDEARKIAREDPSLIWIDDATVHCECGEVTGERCAWSGDIAETVIVEYMPEYLRSSHEAAGNTGMYPANGAIRFRAEKECAKLIVDTEGEWAEVKA